MVGIDSSELDSNGAILIDDIVYFMTKDPARVFLWST